MTLEIKLHEDQTIWCTGSPTIKKEGNIISSKLGDLDCGIVDYPYDIAYSVILEEEGAKIIAETVAQAITQPAEKAQAQNAKDKPAAEPAE